MVAPDKSSTVAFTVVTDANAVQQDTYFVWFDPDKKYKQSAKLRDAIAAFATKTKQQPQEVLVNTKDADLNADIPVRAASFVQENYYYIPYPSA